MHDHRSFCFLIQTTVAFTSNALLSPPHSAEKFAPLDISPIRNIVSLCKQSRLPRGSSAVSHVERPLLRKKAPSVAGDEGVGVFSFSELTLFWKTAFHSSIISTSFHHTTSNDTTFIKISSPGIAVDNERSCFMCEVDPHNPSSRVTATVFLL